MDKSYKKTAKRGSIFNLSYERNGDIVYIDGSLLEQSEYKKVLIFLKQKIAIKKLDLNYNRKNKQFEITDRDRILREDVFIKHLERKISENNSILLAKDKLEKAKLNNESPSVIKQLFREYAITNILFYNKSNFKEYEIFINKMRFGNKEHMIEYLSALKEVTKALEEIGYMQKQNEDVSVIVSIDHKKVLQENFRQSNENLKKLNPSNPDQNTYLINELLKNK